MSMSDAPYASRKPRTMDEVNGVQRYAVGFRLRMQNGQWDDVPDTDFVKIPRGTDPFKVTDLLAAKLSEKHGADVHVIDAVPC